MRGKSFLLCSVLLPRGRAVLTEGEAVLPRLPLSLAEAQCGGAQWQVEFPTPSQPPSSRAGCRPTGDRSGDTCAEDTCWYRGPCWWPKAWAGDVSPLPLLLWVTIGPAVSQALSWPGASWQNVRFLSKGTVIMCNILITFPIRFGYLQLERISRTLADLTLLTVINPFPFDSNQSLESF